MLRVDGQEVGRRQFAPGRRVPRGGCHFGDKGTLLNNRLYSPGEIDKQLGYMEIPVTTPGSGDVMHHPFPEEINHFVECLCEGRDSNLNLADTLKTQEVVFAADRSAAEGHPVKLPLA